MTRTNRLLLLLFCLALSLGASTRSASAQARWQACVTITSAKIYQVGVGYWTDGFGFNIGPSFNGTEIVNGPGTLCINTMLSQQPQDYHTIDEMIIVNIGPGQGLITTVFDLDLVWNECEHPVVLPLYAADQNGPGSIDLQINANYTADINDPEIVVTIDAIDVYAGLLSLFIPGGVGLLETGQLVLSPCCTSDLNCDGETGFADLVAVLSSWGSACDDPETVDVFELCNGDLDADGMVGIVDLISILAGWGPCENPCQ